MLSIKSELAQIKQNYNKTIDIVYGLPYSQSKTIRTIEFYNNSKYLNGQKDELGRDKPFMQILNGICDVENSAKDLDTKDIQITSDDGNHYLESWLLTKECYIWMKETNFAKTLNDMRDMHTRYGSLLVKKVMINGEVSIEMPEWKNVITDQRKIIGRPIIETHWMTAMEIADKTEWTSKETLQKLENTHANKTVPVYEMRGRFSKAMFKDAKGDKYTDADKSKYSYQLYYIAGLPSEEEADIDITACEILYCEDDTEEVYKYLARKPKAGRGFGVGIMEEGEEAQVGSNDAVLKQNRAMEYTTKVIGQTASRKLKGRNLLTETDDGTILEIEEGKPIIPLNLLPSGGLNQYSLIINQWYDQLQKTTSAYSAQRGDTPPSGTPFRLQATVLQQSSSVFKTLQQEMGIFLTEIFDDWIVPNLTKRITKEHILSYDFSPEELKEIDAKFAIRHANKKAVGKILSGGDITAEEYQLFIDNADEFIKQTKSQRFINIPTDFYKNLKAKVTINITGEQRNKAAVLESLNNLYQLYSSNPEAANDPIGQIFILKILELSGAGVSPVQITAAINEKAKEAQAQAALQPAGEKSQVSPLSLSAAPTPQNV